MKARIRCVVVFVVAGVVIACTPDQPDGSDTASTAPTTAAPTTTRSTTLPPSTSPPTSPPPITRPLDPSGYATVGTVCDLLTDAQAVDFGLPSPGEPRSLDAVVLGCQRKHRPTDGLDYILWLDSDLLGSAIARRQNGGSLQVVDIAGQPAVLTESDPDSLCQVTVGLTARQGIEVMASDPQDKACALAVEVAERIVRNLAGEG